MRSHPKAATAGSTQRQATGLGHFLRGADATRALASRVPGSGALAARRLAPAGLLTTLLGLLALLSIGASTAAAADCPNEIRRQEQGVAALNLPDCRAYENASPGSVVSTRQARASISGNHVRYSTTYPAAGEENSGEIYVSIRGSSGWSPRTVVPNPTPSTQSNFGCGPGVFFSPDFSKHVLEQDHEEYDPPEGNAGNPEGFCERSEELLDPREVPGYRTLLLHDEESDTYELIELNPEEGAPGNAYVLDASDDFKRILFKSEAQLTPEAPGVTPEVEGGWNHFVWEEGTVRLATFLPDGTPISAKGINVGNSYEHVLSASGDRFFFKYEGDLYVRLNPTEEPSAIAGEECTEPEKACTVQVDESQGPGESGGGDFQFASDDGSKVFFTADSKLTADSTVETGKPDLYEFDLETGLLADLTVNVGEAADVWEVRGFSEDGSDIYFIAEGALAPGALPGDCHHYTEGATCNLYHLHEGTVDFVAARSVDDIERFGNFNYNGHAVTSVSRPDGQASPNGRYFAFTSHEGLTGYDNTNPETGNPVHELFLYDSAESTLECLSCPHPGAPVAGYSSYAFVPNHQLGGVNLTIRKNQVLDSGQVFFEADGAVVPDDVNGVQDVYQWSGGEAHLISTGTDPHSSAFSDATADGSNAFFVTAESLVNGDVDEAKSLYVARVGGGFPEPPPLPGCEGEACRGSGTDAPDAAAAGSAAFVGAGNLKQAHRRNCGIAAKRAQRLSRNAKRLRRKARQTNNARRSKRLRKRANRFAKRGKQVSRNAKRCRRANRRASK